MGYYINPEKETKEAWLSKHGEEIPAVQALEFDFSGDYLPVCLVDNGSFTAAGIGYHPREVEAFANPDGIMKRWFLVKRTDLEPWYKEPEEKPDVIRGQRV